MEGQTTMSNDSKINVYALSEYTDRNGEDRTRWRKIGVAFENRDEQNPGEVGKGGGSINVILDSLPLDAFTRGEVRLQLRADDSENVRRTQRDDRRDDRRGGRR